MKEDRRSRRGVLRKAALGCLVVVFLVGVFVPGPNNAYLCIAGGVAGGFCYAMWADDS